MLLQSLALVVTGLNLFFELAQIVMLALLVVGNLVQFGLELRAESKRGSNSLFAQGLGCIVQQRFV